MQTHFSAKTMQVRRQADLVRGGTSHVASARGVSWPHCHGTVRSLVGLSCPPSRVQQSPSKD